MKKTALLGTVLFLSPAVSAAFAAPAGVLSEPQIQALILHIRSLAK
jgi:hypothetical protein